MMGLFLVDQWDVFLQIGYDRVHLVRIFLDDKDFLDDLHSGDAWMGEVLHLNGSFKVWVYYWT